MNVFSLLILYIAVAGCILLLSALTGKKNKGYYDRLDKKKHPLKFLYPASALVYAGVSKVFHIRYDTALITRIRRLHIKENVAEELFLHTIKKISIVLMILLVTSLLGAMLCLAHMQSHEIDSLERNAYGEGEAFYDLDVAYGDEKTTMQLVLDEEKLTEKEIRKQFEACAPAVRKTMLGENKSAEYVTKPLDLISSYENISITWEIEDPSVLDYSGNISDDLDENATVLLNLFATFSLEDVTETYTMPVVIAADTSDKTEMLLKEIRKSIEKNNSIYETEVVLPDQLDGKKVVYSKATEHNEYIFLVLAILGVLLILFGYERHLDKDLKKRNEQMLLDFAEIVSKLSLLYEAGLSIYKAWERIVADYEKKEHKEEHFAYQEMKMTLEKIRTGVSEKEAYAQFGKRCGLHPYIKLGNILEQNLSKGSKGMKTLLKQEVRESFEERKRIARKKGEEASTKLLVPMIIMLVIVIVIISVPALLSMQL